MCEQYAKTSNLFTFRKQLQNARVLITGGFLLGVVFWFFFLKINPTAISAPIFYQVEILWLRHSVKRKQSVECTGRQPSAPKTTGQHISFSRFLQIRNRFFNFITLIIMDYSDFQQSQVKPPDRQSLSVTSRNLSEDLIFLLLNLDVAECERPSDPSISTTQLCQRLTGCKADVIYKDRVDATN